VREAWIAHIAGSSCAFLSPFPFPLSRAFRAISSMTKAKLNRRLHTMVVNSFREIFTADLALVCKVRS